MNLFALISHYTINSVHPERCHSASQMSWWYCCYWTRTQSLSGLSQNLSRAPSISLAFGFAHYYHVHTTYTKYTNIRESVDSLCRDGADTPIVRVHWKAFLTREYSRFKPFSAREWPIRPLLYPTIPHK